MQTTQGRERDLRDSPGCYVCGTDNPAGLRVVFTADAAGRAIRGVFHPRSEHQGFEGIVHGGVIAALLDEAMVKLAWHLGMAAVTAELTVKFKAPASPGDELVVSARLTGAAKRLIEADARIDRGPVLIAEARGKLLKTA